MPRLSLCALAFATFALAACNRNEPREIESRTSPAPSPPPPAATVVPFPPTLSRPMPERLVAIGDLHGDLDHARHALRLAGAIDEHDRWIGGRLVVVQTGDEIDRGDDDRAIVDLVDALKKQAAAAGGEVIALLGNHEIMNASLDFRYVTSGGFAAFSLFEANGPSNAKSALPDDEKGRAGAFAPGGSYAKIESARPLVAKVGDTLFVHGGILPKHVAYGLGRMSDEVDDWLAGKRSEPPAIVVAEDGPVWTRAYSREDGPPDCADLTRVLDALGAKRMVVGHTVQRGGVNGACDGKVWRIDVGLSRYFGGPIEVLEVRGDEARPLREK